MRKIGVTASSFLKSKTLMKSLGQVVEPTSYHLKLSSKKIEISQEIIAFCGDCEALLVGREVFDANTLGALPQLKAIVKYGVGLDNLDLKAMDELGIQLFWEKGVNAASVAEQTLGMIIGLLRKIAYSSHLMRRGVWQKDGGVSLRGKVLSIIGCGSIGSAVIPLARAFSMKVQIVDIVKKNRICEEYNSVQVDFETALLSSDIISLHVPLTDLTRNMIDKNALAKMSPRSFIINTSRGEVCDLAAIKYALDDGKLAGAACDVFSKEPFLDEDILKHPHFLATPHISANCKEAVFDMGQAAIRGLSLFLKAPG